MQLEQEIKSLEICINLLCAERDKAHIAGEAALCGFVKGVIAGNHDNEHVFIDGVVRIAGKPVGELAAFFYMLDKVAKNDNLVVTVSVSATKEELPDFVSKYL